MLIWLGKNVLNQRDTQGIQKLDRSGNPTDGPMRVVIELVGDSTPPRVESTAPRSGSGLSEISRGAVQLVG
jgi:hypothetical protein